MAFDGNIWVTYLIFSFVAFLALLGNALVLYVLITRPTYLKHPYNIFIFSLAATDILTAFFLVFSRYLYLPPAPGPDLPNEIYCRTIWSAWVLFTLGYISIYTCLALTIERWLAVAKPLVYRAVKPSHVIRAVILVWLWGITINITTLFRSKFNDSEKKCTWTALSFGNDVFPWIDFTLQSILPFTTMVILYGHILYRLKQSSSNMPSSLNHPIRKVTRVALTASIAMIVGWLPSRVSFMLSKYGIVDPNSLFHYCLVMFSLANSFINPFLYGICSSQFRKDYLGIYKRLFLRNKTRRPSTAAAQSSGQTDDRYKTTRL